MSGNVLYGERQYGRGAEERILKSFVLNRLHLGILWRSQVNIKVGNWIYWVEYTNLEIVNI